MVKKNTYIISLGGSLIVTSAGVDWRFLKKFRELILRQSEKNKKFFIITGGGAICRRYNAAAKKIAKIFSSDLDWMGIQATRLNARLLKAIFRGKAYPEIITNPAAHIRSKKKIVVAGGWRPGWSTDFVSVAMAQEYKVKTVINLSDINYVYDRNPSKYRRAKPIKKIIWKDFYKIVGKKWNPGTNTPFDPVASALAERLGVKVIVVNGKKIKNLSNLLAGKKFQGTVIS